MKRKICIVTGSRAEYGLLKPLLEEIRRDRQLVAQLVVTGMHLSSEFGLTYREIEKDGFFIDAKVKMPLASDSAVGISKSIGIGLMCFARVYERLRPDIVVLLGDRFELLGPSIAAMVGKIPLAHINGGEVTEGAFDDAIRHSITKMSHLHFTSANIYSKRVIQLGENPKSVFTVGQLSLDSIKRTRLLPKKALEKELKFKFNTRNLLVTFHPVTLERDNGQNQLRHLLKVLDRLKDTNIIFTKSNADTGGRLINRIITEYVSKRKNKAVAFTSMGQLKYFSTMQFVDALVGNSSSGIVEAPFFKIATINIGDRQKGRIRVKSIIDCWPTKKSIKEALSRLYSIEFQKNLKNIAYPYGDGTAAKKIKDILKSYNIKNILKKSFYNVSFNNRY